MEKVKKTNIFSVEKFKKINKITLIKILIAIFISLLILGLVLNPELCIGSVYNGLSVWAKCVLPSLFPFMFLTRILTDINVIAPLTAKFSKINKFLFNAPSISAYIFILSVISGYPVGAKLISEFFSMGLLTQKQASKLTTFCSTSGPLFIIGSVGTAMFINAKLGYIMFASHVISSILNGILFRNAYKDFSKTKLINTPDNNLNEILPNSMHNSVLSVLIVGGYIAMFFMIIDLALKFNLFAPLNFILSFVLKPFNLSFETIQAICCGLIEMSKGCLMLSKLNLSTTTLGTIASFLIGFGGFSTFFQALTFLSKCKVSPGFYLLQKFTHAVFSALITLTLCVIL